MLHAKKTSLGSVVRLERRSTPPWLKALLLLVHLLPLALIAASSGLLPLPGIGSVRHAASALFVLLMLVAIAELVDNALLAPPYGRDASLLLSWRGVVLKPADEKMFRSWARKKFSRAQCLLIVSWAVWWNGYNPMGDGATWGSRVYNGLVPWGLVPNLLVCTLATRAFFRQRRAFEDIDALELWLAWACAVGTVSINTVVFLVCADPARGSTQIDRESLSGAALYSTFAVVGASLSLQPFELWTKLALMGANAVAVLGAGALRATYSHNWKALEVRRDVLCSLWTGFALMNLVIHRAIKPYWLRRREVIVTSFDSRD